MGGVGPIPWTAIRDYAVEMGLVGEERDDFRTLIRMADRVFLRHMNPPESDGQAA